MVESLSTDVRSGCYATSDEGVSEADSSGTLVGTFDGAEVLS